jgi:dihydrofolate reductase
MGKLIVTEFTTLDGVAQAPGEPEEDTTGGFLHGGWQAPLMDEKGGNRVFERAKSMDVLLLGRRTYDIFARYWPTADVNSPFTGLLNGVPKCVASRTLTEPLAWQHSTLVREPIAAAIEALKARHDEVHVIGSLDFLQTLLRLGLVDQLELWVYPVLLGTGKRVFADGTLPTALSLIESETYASGCLHLTYDTAGAPTYGIMEAHVPEDA